MKRRQEVGGDSVSRMRRALVLARRGRGWTSPNPMVGAVLVSEDGTILGEGWHRRVGGPHAEIEALTAAKRCGRNPQGATLYVTLEPCSTHGRTPPCTDAILAAGIRRVVVAGIDPNPRHAGRGLSILREAGVEVESGVLEREAMELNEAFNHWIVHRMPFVTVKAAMTLDGKIATARGASQWITGEASRAVGMGLRQGVDAIVVGVNTVLADDPRLTIRDSRMGVAGRERAVRRIVLDSRARTPLNARVVTDGFAAMTTVVVTGAAPRRRVAALGRWVRVWEAPSDARGAVDVGWVLGQLGRGDVASVLVEGGGEVNGSFFDRGCVQRVAFFYAPMILGGRRARRSVAGVGAGSVSEVQGLIDVRWRRVGSDLYLTARVRDQGA